MKLFQIALVLVVASAVPSAAFAQLSPSVDANDDTFFNVDDAYAVIDYLNASPPESIFISDIEDEIDDLEMFYGPLSPAQFARLQFLYAALNYDVNGDGLITAQDALIVINALNTFPFRNNSFPLDVNGDGDDTALDLLNLINRQNVTNPATGQMETRLKLTDAGTPLFYDLSGDSYFTSLDLLIFINNWDGT